MLILGAIAIRYNQFRISRKLRILSVIVLGCIGVLFALSRCERPLLDYMDDYKVLHDIRDENTGKIVELGTLYNFGSTEYEVGVYNEHRPNRSSFELHEQNISIVGSPGPSPKIVQFDGRCYFVVSAYRKGWDKVRPLWKDGRSGKEICFYILTPEGNRIDG
jgi:hypothetical protein